MNPILRLVLEDAAKQRRRKLFLDETSIHRNATSNVKRRERVRLELEAIMAELNGSQAAPQ